MTRLLPLLGVGLFALAYGQAPLSYSNQNQYFLHGAAASGQGLLQHDWLATTIDPTPVFSGLVALTYRFAHPWLFHVYHGILVAMYAAAMIGIFTLFAGDAARGRWPIFLALLTLVHSAAARYASYHLLGLDYPWYFQAGVAGQYVLGAMFQPSVFGVLLVAAIALFAHDRPVSAAFAVALCATVHSTYLLSGAMLTLGFMAALLAEGRLRLAIGMGLLTLALTAPVVMFVAATFAPTSAEIFAQAQSILANERIPHHARVDLWLDPIAALQLAWIAGGVVLARGSRLFWVLLVAATLLAIGTLIQTATGHPTLALLFPWRISAVLIPVATAIALARIVIAPKAWSPWLSGAAASVLVVLAGLSIVIMAGRHAFRTNDAELPLMTFAAETRQPGDTYLLPIRVPDLARTVRGSLSSDFKPLAHKQGDSQIIPIDLQRFRLVAGTPIYVDFKSIPYKDAEVIEWRERLRFGEAVMERLAKGGEVAAALRQHGITHLVVPANRDVNDTGLEAVFTDRSYKVFRVRPGSN